MYQKVSTDLKFVEREKLIEKFWKDNDIFKKSIDQRRKARFTHSMTDLLQLTENRI